MDKIFDDPSVINQQALDLLINDFFVDNPVFYNVKKEGQLLSEDGDYVLGCRAGPQIHVSNLIHEMAHLAEREIEALLKRPVASWGLYHGKRYYIGYSSGYEPDNDKSIFREARVWAFQFNIIKHYQSVVSMHDIDWEADTILEDLARSATYMPAWSIFKYRRYEEEIKGMDYNVQEAHCINKLVEIIGNYAETEYTFDKFVSDWNERMKRLRRYV